ncbi:porin [Hymenobacter elongatus]|uniref:Porin n=1 Tax=Hymenobacter elongatus TaxID=877208 RepID=A0A4Z0PNV5_9BACT|nr:porin [Hymenobacter elongatus]TGE18059.1 porin [Hymenobacter elongatus]
MKAISLLALSLLGAFTTWAQTAPAADSVVTPAQAPATPATAGPLTPYGFVDAYYGYDFKHNDTQDRPGFLYSHDRQNEFTVNNALIGLRYQDEKVRGALGLHAGSYVSANYAAEDQVFKHIYEAYAGFRPFQKAWLDAGIFGAHIGFESAVSKDNWTLSRSLMAENSPYYESGVRFTYELPPRLTLTVLGLNGWQNIRETNQAKALGTQLQWKPTDKLLLNSSGFFGNEQPQDSVKRRRYFHNFYASYTATDRLSLALVFDVGKQEQAARGHRSDTWHTGAAFVRYQLADKWTAALRGEYYNADHGVIINSSMPNVTDADFQVKGASLNLDYAPTGNVLLRVEGRVLNAEEKVFEHKDGRTSDSYGNVTSSIAISF